VASNATNGASDGAACGVSVDVAVIKFCLLLFNVT
jgi:hypothetical protein